MAAAGIAAGASAAAAAATLLIARPTEGPTMLCCCKRSCRKADNDVEPADVDQQLGGSGLVHACVCALATECAFFSGALIPATSCHGRRFVRVVGRRTNRRGVITIAAESVAV